jgi:thermitase
MVRPLIVVFFLSLLFNTSAYSRFSPDRLIVKLKEGQTLPIHKSIKKADVLFGQVVVVTTNDLGVAEKFLRNNPAIDYVEKDYSWEKQSLPKPIPGPINFYDQFSSVFNDPRAANQWHIRDASSQWKGVSLESAVTHFPQEGEEVVVALVDTGIDILHEDLKDHLWANKQEIPGNGIDDDQNGYIDDVHGINTLDRDQEGHATGNMADADGHGTHCAGLIGAVSNNGVGVAGMARNVKLMGIRTVPSSGDEKDVDVIESFIYAAKQGAKIISCSFGKRVNEGGMAVSEAIKYVGDTYGVLVVIAAGNDSEQLTETNRIYPACYPNDNMVVVAASTFQGGMSYFSNWGMAYVDVGSPGSQILSTYPDNQYEFMDGTSMATPIVAGIAAEVLSHAPNLGPLELKKVLLDSVTPNRKFSGKVVSGGIVDMDRALKMAIEHR